MTHCATASRRPRKNCTPHWLHKQAILAYLDRIERGHLPAEMSHLGGEEGAEDEAGEGQAIVTPPFYEFGQDVQPQSVLRAAITAAYRRPEPECVPLLLGQARMPNLDKIRAMATDLVKKLRGKRTGGGVEGLIQEFSLSSQEGVALMCLAEALLRIPDRATRDALIRDKVSRGDWKSHMGGSQSLFVNAATWGLMITGKLVAVNSEQSLSALTRLIGKGGEPLVRGREHGHAHDGRAVRVGPDDFRGAGQQSQDGSARLPLFLRHAGRGGHHGRGRRPLLRVL